MFAMPLTFAWLRPLVALMVPHE